jgi:hypothetical protein
VQRIAALRGGGTLDYVAPWFIKAAQYIQKGSAKIGFVATNSLTQGEQVAQLWPILFERYNLKITFAHQTFAWGSDAPGMAHVHVVILGLAKEVDAPAQKRLFSYATIKDEPRESRHAALSPYLFDASSLANPHIVVKETATAINGLPRLIIGSKPIDGGHYIFSEEEKKAFLADEPAAEAYFRPYIGAREFLNGDVRWILALQNVSPDILKKMPMVRDRIAAVRDVRIKSKSRPTQVLAQTPTRYHINVIPASSFLVIPRVSSERRGYVPFGWMDPPTVPSDAVLILEEATKVQFALLSSAMHRSWLRYIGGRLKNDYRYSIGLVYNTFPTPLVKESSLARLESLAQAVLDARAEHPEATLAELYDPDMMPVNLRRAHGHLDRAVDGLYRKKAFKSDQQRVEHLLVMYEKMTSLPVIAAAKESRKRKSKSA